MSKRKKQVTQLPSYSYKKNVPTIDKEIAWKYECPTWSFKYCDLDHKKWGIHAHLSSNEEPNKLIKNLISLENQTWNQILTRSGKRNSKSHSIDINTLCDEAKGRFKELFSKSNPEYLEEQQERIFSLYCSSKYRIFGFLSQDEKKFQIVWIDPEHKIYPSKKKYT